MLGGTPRRTRSRSRSRDRDRRGEMDRGRRDDRANAAITKIETVPVAWLDGAR